jgi:hypothetical protein
MSIRSASVDRYRRFRPHRALEPVHTPVHTVHTNPLFIGLFASAADAGDWVPQQQIAAIASFWSAERYRKAFGPGDYREGWFLLDDDAVELDEPMGWEPLASDWA